MDILNSEQYDFLKKHIASFDIIVEKGNINNILDAIDDEIVDNIQGNGGSTDEVGSKLQQIFDILNKSIM